MDDFLFKAFDIISTNSEYSVTIIFFIIIMYFYKANNNLQRKLDKKDDRIYKMQEENNNNVIKTAQALGEIKNVMTEIKIKL